MQLGPMTDLPIESVTHSKNRMLYPGFKPTRHTVIHKPVIPAGMTEGLDPMSQSRLPGCFQLIFPGTEYPLPGGYDDIFVNDMDTAGNPITVRSHHRTAQIHFT